MGIQINPLKLLIHARKRDRVDFRRVLTIGRLNIMVPGDQLERLLVNHGLKTRSSPPLYTPSDSQRYADNVFKLLGAEDVTTLDYSPYEGATLLHDMNRPLDSKWDEAFDVVIEGGTIEHVFNFPMAIENCMRAVRVGGRLFICQMANNFCGHGFYNFSPELFYRVLAPEFGYTVEQMLVYEYHRPDKIFQVADPAIVGQRIQIKCRYGTVLLIQAKRTGIGKSPAVFPPQQSDYVSAWQQTGAMAHREEVSSVKARLLRTLCRLPVAGESFNRYLTERGHKNLWHRAHFGDENWFKPFHFDPAG